MKPHPSDNVSFGKLQLSWRFLENCQDPASRRWLQRQLARLTPSEIGHGLHHSSGRTLLQRACELAGVDYEELRRG